MATGLRHLQLVSFSSIRNVLERNLPPASYAAVKNSCFPSGLKVLSETVTLLPRFSGAPVVDCSTRCAARSLYPFGQAGDHNVAQPALFQKAQQLVLEEAGISS
jgi:hypothetical protein